MEPLARLLAFLEIFLVAGIASAEGYPSKSVRLLVPFPPGGSTDMVARMISPKLGELLGQQIFVDYKGGAGGSIGAAQAARAAPDGYTVLLVTDTHAMNHHVYKVPYDFFKSLDPISLLVQAPGILVAHPGFAPSTVKELIDYARANPEKVTYGSAGVGNASHLSGFLFGHMTGVKMTHVPYKGGGPLITDLLGGHVNIAFGTLPLYAQLVKSGKLKLIAVLSKTRIPQFPDAPAAAETVPGFEYKTWYGLLAPAGTPKEIIVRLNREVVRALADTTVKGQLVGRGFDITASSPEAFAAFLRQESDVAGRLVRDLEIKPE